MRIGSWQPLYAGASCSLSSMATLEETLSPTVIQRIERRRAITLQVSPPDDVPLEEALAILEAEVVGPMRSDGRLEGARVTMAGVADKLSGAQRRCH